VSKGKLLAVCLVWLLIVAAAAGAWRYLVAPARDEAARQEQERKRQEQLAGTAADPHYRFQVNLALDSFSGYAVLRSRELQNQLATQRIKLTLIDDQADYPRRLESLRTGEVQLAAFTIDALIKASDQVRDLPATIVAILDETRGADAMVAYKSVFPNIDALNRADTRFVLTPDSPSETLVRVVKSHFHLANLPADPWVPAADAEDVFQRYRQAAATSRQVYVLWEPFVSKMLENQETHVVVDSSRFRGYIVDVLVANRDFLAKNQELVRDFLASYFRARHEHRDGMLALVADDARQAGTPLSSAQAQRLVEGIWWKNTQENYAHFGLSSGRPLQHLEDMITNITDVLRNSGAIASDPTGGRPHLLYYGKVLEELQASQFHPGLTPEAIRDDTIRLPALSDAQWQQLVPVGTLDVPPLIFARGTATLTEASLATLDDLVSKLESWPQYYLLVRGNAAPRGDAEANRALAEARAQTVREHLQGRGIDAGRIQARGAPPDGDSSVTFVLGQPPF